MRLRNPGTKPLTAALVALCMVFAASMATAEDTDIYRATVRNNALLLVDLSGSMSLPVYDHNIDYTTIIEWAEGDATPEQAAVCVRQTHLGSGTPCYGSAVPYRYLATWTWNGLWGKAVGDMAWDKNRIYLVSAKTGWWTVTDEDGQAHSVGEDPLWDGGPQYGIEEFLIEGGIIDTGWEITNWENPLAGNTIETDGEGYVLYPTFLDRNGNGIHMPYNALSETGETDHDPIYSSFPSADHTPATWYNTTTGAGLSGQRFKNHQAIKLTDVRPSSTGVVRDYGFLGYLQTAGIYFSGLFRGPVYNMADFNSYYNHVENHYITDNPSHSYNRET